MKVLLALDANRNLIGKAIREAHGGWYGRLNGKDCAAFTRSETNRKLRDAGAAFVVAVEEDITALGVVIA